MKDFPSERGVSLCSRLQYFFTSLNHICNRLDWIRDGFALTASLLRGEEQ